MKVDKFLELAADFGQRYHFIGGKDFGAVALLDREGRLFTVINGKIASKVNPEALKNISTGNSYCNPGGDALWPAPEGTCFGYEYSTGNWCVPPGITGARYVVKSKGKNPAVIEAEIDLVNDIGIGMPCIFERGIELNRPEKGMKVRESITYIGREALKRDKFLLAPWSLSQLENSQEAEVIFPHVPGAVRDLYDASDAQRFVEKGFCHAKTNASFGYQIAIGEEVEWIAYRNPARNLAVRRAAARMPEELEYIDIIDAPPEARPGGKGARFSVYNDKTGFMAMEALGGCPEILEKGASTGVDVYTSFMSFDKGLNSRSGQGERGALE